MHGGHPPVLCRKGGDGEEVETNEAVALNELGIQYGTDKASICMEKGRYALSHDYLRHYDFLFRNLRLSKISLLEFGCFGGSSLRMWKAYFPNAEIYGVDLDEECKKLEEERIHILVGNAVSEDTCQLVRAEMKRRPYIIVDDASHAWGDQRRTFELFWGLLEPGGFYIVEDLECGSLGAYPNYPPEVQDAQPFFEYMQDRCRPLQWAPDRKNGKETFLFPQLPPKVRQLEQEIDGCLFIPGTVVVRKRDEKAMCQQVKHIRSFRILEQGIEGWFDLVAAHDEECLCFHGWSVCHAEKVKDGRRVLVVGDRESGYMAFDVVMKERPDVVNVFQNDAYFWSGFECYLGIKDILSIPGEHIHIYLGYLLGSEVSMRHVLEFERENATGINLRVTEFQ